MKNRFFILVLSLIIIMSITIIIGGCGDSDDSDDSNNETNLSAAGEDCSETVKCQEGLVCVNEVCEVKDNTENGNNLNNSTDPNSSNNLNNSTDLNSSNNPNNSTDPNSSNNPNNSTNPNNSVELSGEGESCNETAECQDGLICEDELCKSEDDYVNDADIDPTWKAITGSTFDMGCSVNDNDCDDAESPVHSVTLADFQMTATEVTNTQFANFLNTHGNDCLGDPCIYTASASQLRIGESGGVWTADRGYEDRPMIWVSKIAARTYCGWLNGRLPSESEWEYAARAGTTTKYYCGDDPACIEDIACWSKDDSCPVGQKLANDFGLFDMIGNAYEYIEDCWNPTYDDAPTDGTVWGDGTDCQLDMKRGSCFENDSAEDMRVSRRKRELIETVSTTNGFRCVKD